MTVREKPESNLSISAKLLALIIAANMVVLAADYLLITYLDLSSIWNWLHASVLRDKLSTLLFVEDGIAGAFGALVGSGAAESQAAGSVPGGGINAGPELQGRIAKERMQMREGQMGFGLKAVLLGVSLVVLSFIVALSL